MSQWNSLENDLRKWTPRPASPELRRRIFEPAACRAPAAQLRLADFTQWLVPVVGCFLLVMGTLSSRYPAHELYPSSMTNMLLSDNSTSYNDAVIAAYADHSDKNALPTGKLEWSFGGRASVHSVDSASAGSSATSSGPTLVSYTNTIIQ